MALLGSERPQSWANAEESGPLRERLWRHPYAVPLPVAWWCQRRWFCSWVPPKIMGKPPNPLDYHGLSSSLLKLSFGGIARFHTYPDEQMGQSPQPLRSYSTHQAGGFCGVRISKFAFRAAESGFPIFWLSPNIGCPKNPSSLSLFSHRVGRSCRKFPPQFRTNTKYSAACASPLKALGISCYSQKNRILDGYCWVYHH